MRIKKICKYCKKEYKVIKSLDKISKYCCRRCKNNDKKRVITICQYCGKKVYSYPSTIKKYCNIACCDKDKKGKKRLDISKGLTEAHKRKQFGYKKGEQKGDKNPMKRPEVRKKQKQNVKRGKDNYFAQHIFDGKKNSNWQGGISFEPYGLEFNNNLRRLIRKRDNHICKVCGKYGKDVHHIDYNKRNNDPKNLITLCHICHSKTGHNRKVWLKYFKEMINGKS